MNRVQERSSIVDAYAALMHSKTVEATRLRG